ncbi:hypothetical protein [Halorussus marinus]|uniref:hypothetical protein n=1 Tax=Halorussus marinus TaxID=2505976 RepID=UPI00106E8F2A|nr:hypothetical protein [Halorussus marinus]
MDRTLELPNGETVAPDDVFLYNNYPYRVAFPDEADYEFALSPLHWGGGEMDVPFRDRTALVEQWGPDSRGTLSPDEWEQWLEEARHNDRIGDGEVDALARELPVSGGDSARDGGLVGRLRRALGL